MNAEAKDQMIDFLGQRTQLRRIQPPQNAQEQAATAALLQQLEAAAGANNHQVLFPTHVFVKGNEVVGYGSLAAMPVLNFWAHSGKLNAGESIRMIEQGEAVCSHHGLRTVVTLCAENSPFAQHMERLGYQKVGKTVLYVKNI